MEGGTQNYVADETLPFARPWCLFPRKSGHATRALQCKSTIPPGTKSAPFMSDRDADPYSASVKRVGKCDRIRFTGADKTSNCFSCQAGITCTPPFFKLAHRIFHAGAWARASRVEGAASGSEYRDRLLNRAALRASPTAPSHGAFSMTAAHFSNCRVSCGQAII
jgi:hypothetical protein